MESEAKFHSYHDQAEPKEASAEDGLLEKASHEALSDLVERCLETKKHFLDKGQTAEIYSSELNDRICFKIISDSEEWGTVARAEPGSSEPIFHLSLQTEGDFLKDLQGISKEVRVPVPYFHLVRTAPREVDGETIDESIHVLGMERLPAVSVRNVIEQELDLPKGFDLPVFMAKLRRFFDAMHEKGIHHRDAHWGNIMIDTETCMPYVIDFGAASYGNIDEDEPENDVYRELSASRGRRIVLRFKKDDDMLDVLEHQLRQYMKTRAEELTVN
jgi:Phosphotransferase enzyme family